MYHFLSWEFYLLPWLDSFHVSIPLYYAINHFLKKKSKYQCWVFPHISPFRFPNPQLDFKIVLEFFKKRFLEITAEEMCGMGISYLPLYLNQLWYVIICSIITYIWKMSLYIHEFIRLKNEQTCENILSLTDTLKLSSVPTGVKRSHFENSWSRAGIL